MPSGRLDRTWATALRTSFTARSTGTPMLKITKVNEVPSLTREEISSTPFTPRTAPSIRWVTWVSSSVGAAPGCETTTDTAGNSISGLSFTSILRKLTMPASVRATNRTSGGTGLRIDQAEMLRRLIDAILHLFGGPLFQRSHLRDCV